MSLDFFRAQNLQTLCSTDRHAQIIAPHTGILKPELRISAQRADTCTVSAVNACGETRNSIETILTHGLRPFRDLPWSVSSRHGELPAVFLTESGSDQP